jgi:hypothetical protein
VSSYAALDASITHRAFGWFISRAPRLDCIVVVVLNTEICEANYLIGTNFSQVISAT